MTAAAQPARPRWWPAGLAWALWTLAMPGLVVIAWLDHLLRQAARPDVAPFGAGDISPVLALVSAATVGSVLAGRRPRHPVFAFWGRQFELSGGTLRIIPSVIVAGDEYAFALVHASAQRDGRMLEAPGVNVVRLRDGKAVEYWSYTADQYAVDEFWS